MKQVVQSVASGDLRVVDVPRPVPSAAEVLVVTRRTLLSTGTERAVRKLASANLIQKAKARPDLVQQVIRKARTDGLKTTLQSVRARLDEDMPLGYSGVGIVAALGEAVAGLQIGQRVATGSAGHAEFQLVPAHLAVPVPDGVPDADAAFATVAAIALHGLRQAEVGPGSKVAIIGLGLVGQLTARLALASGCDVLGVDIQPAAADRLNAVGGIGLVEDSATTATVLAHTHGRGADAVLLTAATASSGPVRRATELARDRARVVVVGDVGLELERTPFYEKELELRFARSYGPGRYDPTYEEWGVDYPIGYVRWTEGRNMEAFLDLVAGGRVKVGDLVTHTFPVEQAEDAYHSIEQDGTALAVQLVYQADRNAAAEHLEVTPKRTGGQRPGFRNSPGVGLIGAGTYARATLLPAMTAAGYTQRVAVASHSGLSALHIAEHHGFTRAVSSADALLAEPDVDLVIVATRHDSHAELARRALEAGLHVYCEKPLALNINDLVTVEKTWSSGDTHLFVGFNRRWSRPVALVRKHMVGAPGPLVLTYRVNAGELPKAHWYKDRRQGGRLLGEVCHFIDTCAAVVGAEIVEVMTQGAGRDEALLEDDLVVSLRFADGSVAAITYATGGHASTSKERLEILGRGRSAIIDDFRRTVLDGREVRDAGQDKGHAEALRVFGRIIAGEVDGVAATESALATTASTLAAAESMLTGHPIAPQTMR
ncbi:bi-domain-containing oxidoreductase [Frankia sp. CiP3]|uniref:bi-domain-containing oxidoreductase n=1 Tax=Frankia sp. CiP3 TaxID=2880971 RepID=UPI001EF55BA7|nr:bi-domain-containing oxidoreductase [Frankia sp. CiP3]